MRRIQVGITCDEVIFVVGAFSATIEGLFESTSVGTSLLDDISRLIGSQASERILLLQLVQQSAGKLNGDRVVPFDVTDEVFDGLCLLLHTRLTSPQVAPSDKKEMVGIS